MKFTVKHQNRTRIRIHAEQVRMTFEQADIFEYWLSTLPGVEEAKVYDRTCDAAISYKGDARAIFTAIQHFDYDLVEVPQGLVEHSLRPLNAEYQGKLFDRIFMRLVRRYLLPLDIRRVLSWYHAIPLFWKGAKCLIQERKLGVPVLDATAILASLLTGDYNTAGSVMFLLGIGDLLEEWTYKRSVGDLARTMSLNISEVWIKTNDNTEVLVPVTDVKPGDRVVVHAGSMIPFDGTAISGEATVNQASLTGEPLPVRKAEGDTVYAGTALEEGELTFQVKQTGGDSKYEQIVRMIEESEGLKSSVESDAYHMADKLVPYTFGASALTYLFSQNLTKAISVLMVDFSCALKLSIPVAVLSAMREAGRHKITVKGGKFLEAVSKADTLVFDKTGTLTKAQPRVRKVVSFNGMDSGELLRMAACLEEHFPHSIANAVVRAASEQGLKHREMHSKVEYIVAHGIASTIDGKRVTIGSHHFTFEDERNLLPKGTGRKWRLLDDDCSHLYFAIDGELAAVILIEDPLRPEAPEVIHKLKEAGFSKIVMMTGDSERTAAAIAKEVGVDEYYSEVLPEDKSKFVEREKAAGRTVVMVGDGINDSPALSAADVGIAISDGAEIAKEVADITVNGGTLDNILTLKTLSDGLMARIEQNYRFIAAFNGGLIGAGVLGLMQPTQTALLHNGSTIAITLSSMKPLLD